MFSSRTGTTQSAASTRSSYGPDLRRHAAGDDDEPEWFRPIAAAVIKWGPRNNTNIQESGSCSRSVTSQEPRNVSENYWIKNRRAVERRPSGGSYGWVIPRRSTASRTRRRPSTTCARRVSRCTRRTAHSRRGTSTVNAGDYNRPRRSARISDDCGHVLLGSELRAPESAAYDDTVEVPVHAQPRDQARSPTRARSIGR